MFQFLIIKHCQYMSLKYEGNNNTFTIETINLILICLMRAKKFGLK